MRVDPVFRSDTNPNLPDASDPVLSVEPNAELTHDLYSLTTAVLAGVRVGRVRSSLWPDFERNLQGIGNELIEEKQTGSGGCRERVGGLLKSYYRKTA